MERTEHAMRHIKVRVHLPFGHLAGKFQKRFGVHGPFYITTYKKKCYLYYYNLPVSLDLYYNNTAVVISNGVPTKNRGGFCAVHCRSLPGKLSIVRRADLPADREIIIAPCPGE